MKSPHMKNKFTKYVNKTVQGQCHTMRKGTVIKAAFEYHAPIIYIYAHILME